jgi:hypothetical protein
MFHVLVLIKLLEMSCEQMVTKSQVAQLRREQHICSSAERVQPQVAFLDVATS